MKKILTLVLAEFVAMKKTLAAVLVVAFVGLTAGTASAQIPNVQVYFNGNPAYNSFNGTAEVYHPEGTPQEMYVVLLNWNMLVSAADFSIDYPAALFVAGEEIPDPLENIVIGSSNADATSSLGTGPGHGGVTVAFSTPRIAYDPVLVMTVHTFWTSNCDCYRGERSGIVVRGSHYAEIGQGGHADPLAVRYPDYVEIDGVGMTSLICATNSTEQTTWGGVKALYR